MGEGCSQNSGEARGLGSDDLRTGLVVGDALRAGVSALTIQMCGRGKEGVLQVQKHFGGPNLMPNLTPAQSHPCYTESTHTKKERTIWNCNHHRDGTTAGDSASDRSPAEGNNR